MLTGRRWLIVMGIVVLTLVGLGVWRRAELVHERAVARADRIQSIHQLRELRQGLRTASLAAGAVETSTLATRHAAEQIVSQAENLVGQIHTVEQIRDDAAISAVVAGGQVGRMRECLDGINRALNQISVGDPNGPNTLASVRSACRAVGA